MKFSQKYFDFNAEVIIFVAYATTTANVTRLKLGTTLPGELTTLLSDWCSLYALYLDPATHYSVIKDIGDAYDTFHSKIQAVKTMLKTNILITLTNNDYTSLYLHKDAERRVHIPRPDYAPANTVIKQSHLIAEIFTSNPNPPHEVEKKMPDDVAKIGRKIAFVKPDDSPPALNLYHHIEPIGSTVYEIVYTEANLGAKAYLMTCYMNDRGEEGPYSRPVDFFCI